MRRDHGRELTYNLRHLHDVRMRDDVHRAPGRELMHDLRYLYDGRMRERYFFPGARRRSIIDSLSR